MKILLLEDEMMLRGSIKEFLESLSHSVVDCEDGVSAFDHIKKESFDLLLLDVNVPMLSGFNLLQKTKEINIHTPAIFISALIDIEDITMGFTIGCVDYVKKPFHLKELALRIDNISRFRAAKELNHLILTKNYTYNTANKTLYYLQVPETLSKRQLQIIDLLARNLGIVVDFENFRHYVWGDEMIDNATIRAEVNRLKKSLKEDFIKNIRGLGYMVDRVC